MKGRTLRGLSLPKRNGLVGAEVEQSMKAIEDAMCSSTPRLGLGFCFPSAASFFPLRLKRNEACFGPAALSDVVCFRSEQSRF